MYLAKTVCSQVVCGSSHCHHNHPQDEEEAHCHIDGATLHPFHYAPILVCAHIRTRNSQSLFDSREISRVGSVCSVRIIGTLSLLRSPIF